MPLVATIRNAARALKITVLAKLLMPFALLTRLSVTLNGSPRTRIAARYLTGNGLEIGALHSPLKLPRGAIAKYVDVLPLKELRQKYPEQDGVRITPPDYIDDGFTLESIPDSSQDFVVANHVMEHSPNPLGVLQNWVRVLRPGGVLFLTVPVAEACFDRGRPETPLEHILNDYELCRTGDIESFYHRNLEHYSEWVGISVVNQQREIGQEVVPPTSAEARIQARALAAAGAEIHFHTFSANSFDRLVRHFVSTAPRSLSLSEIADLGGEVVAVLRKGN